MAGMEESGHTKQAHEDYGPEWQRLRRDELQAVAIMFGGLSVLAIVGTIVWLVLGPDFGKYAFGFLGVIWFITASMALARVRFFRCPRCRRGFFMGDFVVGPLLNSYAGKCAHCRLPVWAKCADRSLDRSPGWTFREHP